MERQISTIKEDGEEFNTLLMSFTARGQRNSLVHFKYNQNGANQEGTVVDVVFMTEIIGAWQGSKAVRPIRIVHIEPQS